MRVACVVLSLGLQQAPSRPSISVEAAAYLAEALATMREHSFFREKLDWTAIRRTAFEAATGAEVPADTYQAIRGALAALGDHHSFLQLSSELEQLENARLEARGIRITEPESAQSGPISPFVMRRTAEGDLHETDAGAVARIVVPFFMGADPDRFARQLQEAVAKLDREEPIGWVVDLRGNGGGNMWPMLAGIGPILGEGRIGAFLKVEGSGESWYYRTGKAGAENADGSGGWVGATVEHPHTLKKSPAVAVLIDACTASSGEAVAIAFKGRPDTRFIGTPTRGLSSSNQGFQLVDGANLVITVGLDVDRTGKAYPDQVHPDEVVEGPAKPDGKDLQLARAIEWLVEQSDS